MITICPDAAQRGNGRVGRHEPWPDFRNPRTLERQHVGKVLTGGTRPIYGIFHREPHELVLRFLKHHKPLRSGLLHAILLQPTSLVLRSQKGEELDWDTIRAWLP